MFSYPVSVVYTRTQKTLCYVSEDRATAHVCDPNVWALSSEQLPDAETEAEGRSKAARLHLQGCGAARIFHRLHGKQLVYICPVRKDE